MVRYASQRLPLTISDYSFIDKYTCSFPQDSLISIKTPVISLSQDSTLGKILTMFVRLLISLLTRSAKFVVLNLILCVALKLNTVKPSGIEFSIHSLNFGADFSYFEIISDNCLSASNLLGALKITLISSATSFFILCLGIYDCAFCCK